MEITIHDNINKNKLLFRVISFFFSIILSFELYNWVRLVRENNANNL